MPYAPPNAGLFTVKNPDQHEANKTGPRWGNQDVLRVSLADIVGHGCLLSLLASCDAVITLPGSVEVTRKDKKLARRRPFPTLLRQLQ